MFQVNVYCKLTATGSYQIVVFGFGFWDLRLRIEGLRLRILGCSELFAGASLPFRCFYKASRFQEYKSRMSSRIAMKSLSGPKCKSFSGGFSVLNPKTLSRKQRWVEGR